MDYILYAMIGVGVLCFFMKFFLYRMLRQIGKEAAKMGNSVHPLMKMLMKRFETCYELKMGVNNVDIYVEKYLRSYKKAGISLATWEAWCEVLFAISVLGCIGMNAYLIWTQARGYGNPGLSWSSLSVFLGTLLPCILLFFQDLFLNLSYQKESAKIEILDYLENICQPRFENETFRKDQMQEYQREYFDEERQQLDEILRPEQIRFTEEEEKVIEEVLKEYMA